MFPGGYSLVKWPVVLGLCLLLSPSGLPAEKSPDAGGIRFCVPFWVLKDGAPVQPRMGREDLSIFAGPEPLQVTRQEQPGTATFLFLAFDLVEDQAPINAAKQALGEEIRKLGPEYWVGLIEVQETLSVIQDPTRDKRLLLKKIRQSRQFGKAGLLESVQALADFSSSLMRKSSVRVAVILVTDSDVANYRTEYRNPTINRSDRRDLSRSLSGPGAAGRNLSPVGSPGAFPRPPCWWSTWLRGETPSTAPTRTAWCRLPAPREAGCSFPSLPGTFRALSRKPFNGRTVSMPLNSKSLRGRAACSRSRPGLAPPFPPPCG